MDIKVPKSLNAISIVLKTCNFVQGKTTDLPRISSKDLDLI